MTEEPQYVVTFDRRTVVGPGALDGLRRMGLDEARRTLRLAARIPKHGQIIDCTTLEPVSGTDD